MSRSLDEGPRFSRPSPQPPGESGAVARKREGARHTARAPEFWVLRFSLIASITTLCYVLAPFGLAGWRAAAGGLAVALVILLAEWRLRRAGTGELLGGTAGAVIGIFAAALVSLVISRTSAPEAAKSFFEYAALLAFGYVGLMLGAARGGELRVDSFKGMARDARPRDALKLLDTSVLIDGRIADVCEAHFLDGVLAVPQFVLHELQLVADSAEAMKRQRGRRGLEVLQRMQKMTQIEVRILDQNLPESGDVDHKLVELARRVGAKIVTNDFNLNKVATVQGLEVLNVNQLANALKPVVLPGEAMRVLILREGKEAHQGVAFLDDGTMVVVEGGRRLINKSVDVLVTSVHQTPAGKMIFGRLDERVEQPGAVARQAAAAAAGRGEGNGHGRGDGSNRLEYGARASESTQVERSGRPAFPDPAAD